MSLSKHKRKIVLATGLFVLGIIIFVIVLRNADVEEIITHLEKVSFLKVVGLVLLSIFIFCFYAFNLKTVLRSYGARINFVKVTILRLIGDSVSYVTPVMYIGGELMSAYILKKDHDLPFSKGMASIVLDKMISLTVTIFYLVVGIIIFIVYFVEDIKILIPTIIVLVASVGFLAFFYRKTWRNQGLLFSLLKVFGLHKIKFFSNSKENIDQFDYQLHYFFKYRRRYFFYALAIIFTATVVTIGEYKLILYFLGIDMSLLNIILLRVIFIASTAVPIPGGLGTVEAGQAGYFSLIGLGASTGVSFILIIRFLQLINVSVGLVMLSIYGFKIFKPPQLANNGNE
ncbi:MAG: lysylphosphatidylglycerol synthase transmembrane domain-containing protein [Patescibacteria group bacterium]